MRCDLQPVDHPALRMPSGGFTDERPCLFKGSGFGHTPVIFPPEGQDRIDRHARIQGCQPVEKCSRVLFQFAGFALGPVIGPVRNGDQVRRYGIRFIQQGGVEDLRADPLVEHLGIQSICQLIGVRQRGVNGIVSVGNGIAEADHGPFLCHGFDLFRADDLQFFHGHDAQSGQIDRYRVQFAIQRNLHFQIRFFP